MEWRRSSGVSWNPASLTPPGTREVPASVDKALLPVLESAGPACGLRFEWSVNEAVLAAKVLGRATLTHSRGFGFMKNIGLNIALDALSTMSIKSTFNSGTLFLVAADPQPHRSQTAQDNRYLLSSLHVPLLEPGSPQEALQMTREALDLSERYRFPFFMHMNPLVLESEGPVRLGDLPLPPLLGTPSGLPPAGRKRCVVWLSRDHGSRTAAETYLDSLLESADAAPSNTASRVADFILDLEKTHAEARRS